MLKHIATRACAYARPLLDSVTLIARAVHRSAQKTDQGENLMGQTSSDSTATDLGAEGHGKEAATGPSKRDVDRFREGTHRRLYELLGARPLSADPAQGAAFAVWAPRAETVSVIGSFNAWRPGADSLVPRADGSGIWEGRVRAARPGALYKFRIEASGFAADRPDPCARWMEPPPGTASRFLARHHEWADQDWQRERRQRQDQAAPVAIYELHLGSWRRSVLADGETRYLSYLELADGLADHVAGLGFTHVLLLPVMEHPRYESLGAAISGLFAPSTRYGPPEDLMALIDQLHRRGIGVILDWSPFRLATDAELTRFDGAPLLEQAGSSEDDADVPGADGAVPFDLSRPEVRALLLSSAVFWVEQFHADGLRITAPARDGATADPQATALIDEVIDAIHDEFPGVLCIAQPADGATRASADCELQQDRSADAQLVATMSDADCGRRQAALESEGREAADQRLRALAHDEIAAGGSLLARMPGDSWQQRANLRLLLGWLYVACGRKLLFMGTEIAQYQPWQPQFSLDWHLLQEAGHRAMMTWVGDLNRLYRSTPVLHKAPEDQEALVAMPVGQAGGDCIVALARQGGEHYQHLLAVFNVGVTPIRDCRIGVPGAGTWEEVLNSDAWMYGGSDRGNLGRQEADPVAVGDQYNSLLLTLPPLGVLFLRQQGAPASMP